MTLLNQSPMPTTFFFGALAANEFIGVKGSGIHGQIYD